MDVFNIYKDKKQAKFWKKAGEEFGYLYWVRAMISKDADTRGEILKINVPENYFEFPAARAEIYGLLAQAYLEPTPIFIEEVANTKFHENLKKYFSVLDQLYEIKFKLLAPSLEEEGSVCN